MAPTPFRLRARGARLQPQVLEFFAGIGLARMGLEAAGFKVTWANDYEPDKKAMYTAQFGDDAHFVLGDIAAVTPADLPHGAQLAWASSPCTDLSLAGNRAGLDGDQSGTFWQWIRLLGGLGDQRPPVVVLENVVGLATSHGGDDLTAAIRAMNGLGYSVDVLAIDARRFVPQSRPRLFVVGAQNAPADDPMANPDLRPEWLSWVFSDKSLVTHRATLPEPPAHRVDGLSGVIEPIPLDDERWWSQERTDAFIASLSPIQWERLNRLRREHGSSYRTAYRRTRAGVAVWEVRADEISGCLRTARGGSSKQAVVRVGAGKIRIRWMTPCEYARLMGAGEYDLASARANQALFGFGDAVAVPVVEWLAQNYLMPLIRSVWGIDEAAQGDVANVK